MNLAQAFHLNPSTRLALVGAGGKTAALFQTARDYLKTCETPAVLLTTTTHLAQEQTRLADRHIIIEHADQLGALDTELAAGVVLVTGPLSREVDCPPRLIGLDQAGLSHLSALAADNLTPLLIEADGSRRLPLKAPAEHEPAIPSFTDTVVVVAGLTGLGKPLNDQWVHRAQRFAGLSGLSLGQPVSAQALVRVLTHPQGGLKGIPPNSRRVLLLNQANTQDLQAIAFSITTQLLQSFHAVVIANLVDYCMKAETGGENSVSSAQASKIYAIHEPVAGIILAAGGASRFGQPKQLLPWHDEPLVHHCAQTAIRAGLSPVIAVSGEANPQLSLALADLDVRVVHNPKWQQGQSTSLQAGLQALTRETGAAIFLLSDQPRVPVDLLKALVESHATSQAAIVAPLVDGQRANPVLFDRQTFPELMKITGDKGGRELFSRYPIQWVIWHDRSVLLDIDTPEDYQRLIDGREKT